MQKSPKIFIWQGAWKGGAENITFQIAEYVKKEFNAEVTLGVFKGEKNFEVPFKQIEVTRALPKKLVAYNNLLASLLVWAQYKEYDYVLTHTAGFWKRSGVKFIYREPGNLKLLLSSLSLKSKLVYFLPYLAAKHSILHCDIPVSASRKADEFFVQCGRKSFIQSTNFVNIASLPNINQLSYQEKDKFKIAFIGRNDKLKRLSLLIDVVNKAGAEDNLELHVFGSRGRDTDFVKYHGWVPGEKVLDFLSAKAHAFVLPSVFEASSVSLLHALMLGVPTVVSVNALPIELSAYAQSFQTKEDLHQSLVELKQNYPARKKTAESNSNEIREKFSLGKVLKKEFETIFAWGENQESQRK